MKKLDLELLNHACSKDGAAIRIRTKLLPVGGSDDKIFPPTYAGESHAVYAVEKRRIGEREVATVLLDSVQSQANRLEQGLLEAVEDEGLQIPVIEVNFASAFEGRKKVTSLDAPHRIADALIRDSLVISENKRPFAKSTIGRRFTASSYADATALFEYCPRPSSLAYGIRMAPAVGLETSSHARLFPRSWDSMQWPACGLAGNSILSTLARKSKGGSTNTKTPTKSGPSTKQTQPRTRKENLSWRERIRRKRVSPLRSDTEISLRRSSNTKTRKGTQRLNRMPAA